MKTLKKLQMSLMLGCLILLSGASIAAADTPPAPAPAGSTLPQRIQQREQERAITLSDQDKARVVSTCVSAQGKIRVIQNQAVTSLANRQKVYQRIDAKLWVTIGQLKLANQDTYQLEKDRAALADKTTNFQTLATNYQQTLDDSAVINCQADPLGFRALVSTAQQYYALLQTQSSDSGDYVINTVKTELASHISDLQSKNADQGN